MFTRRLLLLAFAWTVLLYGPTTAIITGKVSLKSKLFAAASNPPPPDTFLETWVLDKGTWRCAVYAAVHPPSNSRSEMAVSAATSAPNPSTPYQGTLWPSSSRFG